MIRSKKDQRRHDFANLRQGLISMTRLSHMPEFYVDPIVLPMAMAGLDYIEQRSKITPKLLPEPDGGVSFTYMDPEIQMKYYILFHKEGIETCTMSLMDLKRKGPSHEQ